MGMTTAQACGLACGQVPPPSHSGPTGVRLWAIATLGRHQTDTSGGHGLWGDEALWLSARGFVAAGITRPGLTTQLVRFPQWDITHGSQGSSSESAAGAQPIGAAAQRWVLGV